jgi:hypothetical protein
MLRFASALCTTAWIFSFGCGYVGPVRPPSLHLAQRVPDLGAAERGSKLEYAFTLPRTTTDGESIHRFDSIDLAVGVRPEPFDFTRWSDQAKHYQIQAPEPPPKMKGDDENDKPLRVDSSIPVDTWAGKDVAIGVRTAIRGTRYSQWSNIVRLDVVEPLPRPEVSAASDPKGVKLTWNEPRAGLQYHIRRRSSANAQSLDVGTSEMPEFVDAGAQYGTEYSYTVTAIAAGEHKDAASEPSAPVSITPKDTFPPTVPSGVAALATPNSIEVSWERSPESDTKGYYVYRSIAGQSFERIGNLVALPTYSDKDVQTGKQYQYQVSAVDERNNESARSSPVEVTF